MPLVSALGTAVVLPSCLRLQLWLCFRSRFLPRTATWGAGNPKDMGAASLLPSAFLLEGKKSGGEWGVAANGVSMGGREERGRKCAEIRSS